jgi:hypothetical protein
MGRFFPVKADKTAASLPTAMTPPAVDPVPTSRGATSAAAASSPTGDVLPAGLTLELVDWAEDLRVTVDDSCVLACSSRLCILHNILHHTLHFYFSPYSDVVTITMQRAGARNALRLGLLKRLLLTFAHLTHLPFVTPAPTPAAKLGTGATILVRTICFCFC